MNHKWMQSGALLALSFSLLASTQPVEAQNAPKTGESLGFEQLSTQKLAPARLQLKSLGKGWQRLTVESGQDDGLAAIYGGFRGGVFQDALANEGVGVYFTKGQSVVLGSETFLVTYRIERNLTQQDIQDLFRNFGGGGNNAGPTGPRKFSPDTVLLLSLLNLRTIGSLKDVRPFDAKRDIMGASDVIEASTDNLQALGGFLQQISRQNQYGLQRLPLRDAASMRQTFTNYFHARQSIFVHPQTKEAYRTNAVLAKKPIRVVPNRARVVAIYEARPGTDGKYGTVFLDGHVERVPQAQWKRVRAVVPQEPTFQETQLLSAANLRRLRNALLSYTRRRQGSLPQMRSASAVRQELNNYAGTWNATYFKHPTTGEAYRPNALLSQKKLTRITNQSRLIAFYEVKPDREGKRSAVFLDGHVERIAASRWNRVRSVPVRLKRAA